MSPFNQVKVCGGCHETDSGLIAGYMDSVHGRGLLKSGLVSSASCSDCHGYHTVVKTDNPESPTAHANSPNMCGSCHQMVLETWLKDSSHGMAWKAGNKNAPVCTDCHHSHKIDDPIKHEHRLHLPEECGSCHGALYSSYRHTFHGKATNLGMETSATCADCHTAHATLPADDPKSSIHPDNLKEHCSMCHEGAPENFFDIDPHNDPTDPNDPDDPDDPASAAGKPAESALAGRSVGRAWVGLVSFALLGAGVLLWLELHPPEALRAAAKALAGK